MAASGQPGSIAILGATSHIARDFILTMRSRTDRNLHLYARQPDRVSAFLAGNGLQNEYAIAPLADFPNGKHSAVINFIGVGDPARAKEMGEAILPITQEWDFKVLAYLQANPEVTYIFMSSGAVYGDNFDAPVNENSTASIPINDLKQTNFYTVAKQYAETLHRAHKNLTIFDIRIFNYVSPSIDLSARFLIAEMFSALKQGRVFKTDQSPVVRDYLHPVDFGALVGACLSAPRGSNFPVDAYSQGPISKQELLELMSEFGLRYDIVPVVDVINATGRKPFYFSENRRASNLGYSPSYSSRSGILEVGRTILAGQV